MKYYSFLLLPVFLLITACQPEPGPKAPLPPVGVPAPPPVEADELSVGDELFPWVNGVNVRSQPSTSGKRVARVLEDEALVYLGEQSANAETVVLRGVAYHEPWFKVRAKDGTEGWIFGGTIREADEEKGNPELSDLKLVFPYFGRYNLSDWEKISEQSEEGGDAETQEVVYRKDAQTMKITKTDVGEYGYTHTYTIMDVEDRVILERHLEFTADPDLMLRETVINHLQSPSMTHTRSQRLDKHPLRLNARPVMVNGEWREIK